ncbi:AT hook-containing protein attf-4 [Caenorhabditis elegans]|uniref:AT hook-containing protein attf-4 n=3 Tax=Caenorhabditis elegans TaxID=6239 RepID=ATTF4_CAEEL|nr:AT hook-containing protein attf-4 [Caenorhabditis elegans]Q11178.2 RecName: Full=AT hook-containing protein attf-4 [Caenorhabditis elegans]CCD63170.1 AT hook-containing protein attf-4 [Caenorhabditis elegans]|eukprot:NP_741168.1 AT hook-containing protein attf-4 [Caenorhabditis elegans]
MLQPPTLTPNANGEEFRGSVSTDRSSASPSNIDEIMEDDVNQKDEDEDLNLVDRVSKLETNFVFIQHQLSSIMNHLHAPQCKCTTCSKVNQPGAEEQKNDTSVLSQLFPNASDQQLKTLLDLSKMNKLPSQVVHKDQQNGSSFLPSANKTSENPKPIELKPLKLGQGYQMANGGGGGKIHTERLSEPARKQSRKVGFPPPVASYYQRKESSNPLVPPTPLSSIPNLITNSNAVSANTSTASPGPSSEGSGDDHLEAPNEVAHMHSSTVPATPTTPGANLFTQSMVDMLKLNAQNAAHSTGSPGFLRGRGRGRPKLIGDELDADLVDYMVSLKNSDPHGGHFTASQALHMARQYILERAPGLLEEHGGHVKLKLTWAMKLVSRIGERQREIELGLPAGTLSNMGRNLTNIPAGGNFMADMMAQNIFSQHMMMVNQQLEGGSPPASSSSTATTSTATKTVKQESKNGHQNEENLNVKQEASTMPEIINIKELNLPFLNNFLAELNDNNSGLIDGEIGAAGPSMAALFAPNA